MRVLAILVALVCLAAAFGLVALLLAAKRRRTALDRMHDVLADGPHAAAPRIAAPEPVLPAFLLHRLVRAGWDPYHRQLMVAVALLVGVSLTAALVAGPLAGALCALLVILIGMAVLEQRAAANMSLLSGSMLGFLERICQLLSVGHSLPVALQRATDNSPPVVARCLASTMRRIANGAGVAESIERCAADLDLYELHLLATATRTNLRFGGSMTSILKNTIDNIRRRGAVERELRANTTQIRASAWVLALLPLFVGSVVMFTNQSYSRWFLATSAGHMMIAYALVSQAIGGFCMRLIVKTRF